MEAAAQENRPISEGGSITFREHYDFFKIELMLTGTNLETSKTQIFNYKQTPEFPVIHAVCISMGIPIAFKPYIIRKKFPELKGVWVDGGVFNNFPISEFEGRKEDQSMEVNTLGLRLTVDTPSPVYDGFTLIKQYAKGALTGAGESQATDAMSNQAIVLDTDGLDTLDFNPPDANRDQAVQAAYLKTRSFFDYGSLMVTVAVSTYQYVPGGYYAWSEVYNADKIPKKVSIKSMTNGLLLLQPGSLSNGNHAMLPPGSRLKIWIGTRSRGEGPGRMPQVIEGRVELESDAGALDFTVRLAGK